MNYIRYLYRRCVPTMTPGQAQEFTANQPRTVDDFITRTIIQRADVDAVIEKIEQLHRDGKREVNAKVIADEFGFSFDKTRAIFKEIVKREPLINGVVVEWISK